MPATAAYLYLLDNAIKNSGKQKSDFKDDSKICSNSYAKVLKNKIAKMNATFLNTKSNFC